MRSLRDVRRARSARTAPTVVLLLTLAAALLSTVPSGASAAAQAGATVVQLGGPGQRVAARVPEESATNPDFIDIPASCYTPEETLSTDPCRLVPRKPGAPLIVLWGDSHAWMMTPAIRKAVAGKKVNVITFMQGACPVMNPDLSTPAKNEARNGCDVFNQSVVRYLDKARKWDRPLRVIVAMSWELYHNASTPPDAADERYPGYLNDYVRVNARKSQQGTPRAFRALARMRIRTDVVAAQPMVYQTAPPCPTRGFLCPLPRQAVLKDAAANNARVRELRGMLSVRGRLIKPAQTLCTKTECRGVLDGVPVYYDRLHIGQRTSYRLSPHFAPTVSELVQEARRARRAR